METANNDLTYKLKEAETSRNDEKLKRETVEVELKGLQEKHKVVLGENEALKIEV